ncbi:MAG: glucose 1-dehydrogenase [Pirellulaceae bacterium]|nr:glucose 1-dehydrogenase [Planctomycetales bacterium]
MKLLGKVALVTGAARGIGRGCALELARAGADVAINDRQSSPDTESLVAEIASLGRQATVVAGDAFDRSSCERIVGQAIEAFGRLDVLVSNPAYSRRAPFLEYDAETFEQVLRGTLTAHFHMSQLVARRMVEQAAGGKIVFISSVQNRIPFPNSVAYNAAKSGLINMARTIATELLPHSINVNAIEPGWIDTPGEHEAFGDEAVRDGAAKLPWRRLGTPADIGKAAVFLASSDADYITGTSLLVDGGLCLEFARRGI